MLRIPPRYRQLIATTIPSDFWHRIRSPFALHLWRPLPCGRCQTSRLLLDNLRRMPSLLHREAPPALSVWPLDAAFATKAEARRFNSPHCCGYVSRCYIWVHCTLRPAVSRRGAWASVGSVSPLSACFRRDSHLFALGPRYMALDSYHVETLTHGCSLLAAHVLGRN